MSESEDLKLPPNAGLDEIKRAFRRRALVLHPDHNPDPAAARHFRRLTEVYRILVAGAAREAPRRRQIPLSERISFVLADVRSAAKRWPIAQWSKTVDGLPKAVWLASVLEVLAQAWPGSPPPDPIVPTLEGVIQGLEDWAERLRAHPLPHPLSKLAARPLTEAVKAAEERLRALERPARGS